MEKIYVIKTKNGTTLNWYDTLEEAEHHIKLFESDDKKSGIYEDNYYHIIEFTEDMSLEKYEFLESEVKSNDIIQ